MWTNNSSSEAGSMEEEGDIHVIYLATTVYLCLLAAMGCLGNGLVLVTMARMAQLQHMTYVLVGNLSLVGLLNCVLTIPLHVANMLLGRSLWHLDRRHGMCRFQGFINFSLILSTLVNSAGIAVCRYRTVTARHDIRGRTQPKHAIAKLLGFLWALPVFSALTAVPFLGFNSLLSDCYFTDFGQAFWYMTIGLSVPALVSTGTMLVLYARIIKKVRDSNLKIQSFDPKRTGDASSSLQQVKPDKNVSESELVSNRNEWSSAQNQLETEPKRMGGITIFTTMALDDAVHTPSTSYDPGTLREETIPSLDQDHATRPSPVTADSKQEINESHLQPPGKAKLSRQVSTQSRESASIPSCSSFNASVSSDVSGKPTRKSRRRRRRVITEKKLTFHLFLASILFCLCYLPLCLVHLVHAFHPLDQGVWLTCYTLALSFSSNAWLVYALLNRDFRRAFEAFLKGRRSF